MQLHNIKRTSKILKDLSLLKLAVPKGNQVKQIEKIKEKFEDLKTNWEGFTKALSAQINTYEEENKKICERVKKLQNFSTEVRRQKIRMRSQEIVIVSREKSLSKSLKRVKKWWRKSLTNMEDSLKIRNSESERLSLELHQANLDLSQDFENAIECGSEFFIEKRKRISVEPVSWFENDSDVYRGRSFKFHSREKTKIENVTLSDSISLIEVKKALCILKKANLLEDENNADLMKIVEMVNSNENTSNFELILQLLNIEGRKKKARAGSEDASGKENGIETYNEIEDANHVKLEDLLMVGEELNEIGLKSLNSSFVDQMDLGMVVSDGSKNEIFDLF